MIMMKKMINKIRKLQMIKISFQMKNHVRMIFLSKIKMSSKFLMKKQAILNS